MSKEDLSAAVPPGLHDLVWAKVEGHHYWPALVCSPPSWDTEKNTTDRVHVRFFDEQTSRAWVKVRLTKPFTGPWHRQVPQRPSERGWDKGVAEAVRALALEPSGRPALFPPYEQGGSGSEEAEDDPLEVSAESVAPSESSEGSDVDYRPGKARSSSSSSKEMGGNSVLDLQFRKKALHKKAPKRKPLGPRSTELSSPAKRPTTPKSTRGASRQANKRGAGCTGDGGAADDFLKEGKRRDACGRLADHPEFNPRTLRIPESFKAKLSPAMRQWWEVKAEHFDAVVFFKVGRVYQLHHMDAVIGVEQLGLTWTQGDGTSCSLPERDYARHADALIHKGHKVARVEEVESCRKGRRPGKVEREVRRELCRITSKATRTFGPQDGQLCGPDACWLLAIAHQEVEEGIRIGVCFVDTSIGKFHLGQFEDDSSCGRLRTALTRYPPAQVLYEQQPPLPEQLRQLLEEGPLHSVPREALRPWKEFPDARRALQLLRDGAYFAAEGEEGSSAQYPEAVATFMDAADKTNLSPREDDCLALKALGACVWYLSESLIDEEVLTMCSFELYVPQATSGDSASLEGHERSMVLDAACLQSLQVLQNTSGGTEGTLLAALDSCCTPFGKRQFQQELCEPPCDLERILARRQAVDDLLAASEAARKSRGILRSLPDLERLLARIHSQGLERRSDHPDQRAILSEEAAYNECRSTTLLQALEGFERAVQVVPLWKPLLRRLTSGLLKGCVSIGGERLPELLEALGDIKRAFNHERGRCPTLARGVDPHYDEAVKRVRVADGALRDYLRMQSRHFGCKVAYVGSDEHRGQLEVPEDVAHRADCTYQLQGQREGFRYYCTEQLGQLAASVVRAEAAKEAALKGALHRLCGKFNRRRPLWEQVVQCLSQLDCLLSLAAYSSSVGDPGCTPSFLPPESTGPRLRIKAGRHPCLLLQQTDVASDVCLGHPQAGTAQEGPLLLAPAAGRPSEGGQAAALLVMVAHLGARVPAQVCELTPVDRIITRLGTSGRVISGEGASSSVEAYAILRNATRHSLVLLDG